ncbi:MAG: prealbumin-like fold domain-containing protein [Bacilli bacterium]|nr:prealbumin-like fold domain-containing protein [Bacilli bacterium]
MKNNVLFKIKYSLLVLFLMIFLNLNIKALDGFPPSNWTNIKNAKDISGILTKDNNEYSDYTFTPIPNGRSIYGPFSFTAFSNDSTYNGVYQSNGTSLFKSFLDTYGTSLSATRYEFNLRNLKDSLKDHIGVLFKNIGYYQGDIIDMKMSINNFTLPKDDGLFVKQNGLIINKNFSIDLINLNSVSIKYSFFKAGSDTPIKVKGYWTFNDIDGYQSITTNAKNISGKQWVGLNNIVYQATTVGNDNTYYHYFEKDGLYYSDYSGNYPNDFEKSSWGHEFNSSALIYTYNNNAFMHAPNPRQSLIEFTYTTKSPIKPSIPFPTKSINTNTDLKNILTNTQHNLDLNENKIFNDATLYHYHIIQQTPYLADPSHYFKSLILSDTLASILEVDLNKIKVISSIDNKDLTNDFDISLTNNHVTIKAKTSILTSLNFYNNQIIFDIPFLIKKNLNEQELKSYLIENKLNQYQINNVAQINIDNKPISTNEVSIKTNIKPEAYLEKYDDVNYLKIGDIYNYYLKFGNKDHKATLKDVHVLDNLPDYLEYQLNSTTIDDQEISDNIWHNNKLDYYHDSIPSAQEHILKFKVKLIKTPLNNNRLITNEVVLNSSNHVSLKASYENKLLPNPRITKKILNDNIHLNDVITYEIIIKNEQDSGRYQDIILSDNLEDYLQYEPHSTKISPLIQNENNLKENDYLLLDDDCWQDSKLNYSIKELPENNYLILRYDVKLIKYPLNNIIYNQSSIISHFDYQRTDKLLGINIPLSADISKDILIPIEIEKLDFNNHQNVAGATFELYHDDNSKQLIKSWTSSILPFTIELSNGHYLLKEVKAPFGYENNHKLNKFIIDKNAIHKKISIMNKPIPIPKTGYELHQILRAIMSINYFEK